MRRETQIGKDIIEAQRKVIQHLKIAITHQKEQIKQFEKMLSREEDRNDPSRT